MAPSKEEFRFFLLLPQSKIIPMATTSFSPTVLLIQMMKEYKSCAYATEKNPNDAIISIGILGFNQSDQNVESQGVKCLLTVSFTCFPHRYRLDFFLLLFALFTCSTGPDQVHGFMFRIEAVTTSPFQLLL